jgi:hypothetical protein
MYTSFQDPCMTGVALVLANSRLGFSSFIKDRHGDKLSSPSDLSENQVHVEDIGRVVMS